MSSNRVKVPVTKNVSPVVSGNILPLAPLYEGIILALLLTLLASITVINTFLRYEKTCTVQCTVTVNKPSNIKVCKSRFNPET